MPCKAMAHSPKFAIDTVNLDSQGINLGSQGIDLAVDCTKLFPLLVNLCPDACDLRLKACNWSIFDVDKQLGERRGLYSDSHRYCLTRSPTWGCRGVEDRGYFWEE